MKAVAVYEAKTRLSEMLCEVEQGEQFTITRRGTPVAYLIAAKPAVQPLVDAAQCKAQAFSVPNATENMLQVTIVLNSCLQGKGWLQQPAKAGQQ